MTVMLNPGNTHSDLSTPFQVSHLQELEAESIFIIREVAAQFERPALLFSGGKDSIILSHLARKAFWPARIPFPLLHIDTGHNFPETLSYRDEWMETIGARLIVRSVQDSIDQGRAVEEKGYNASRNMLQTVTLLDAIEELKVDAPKSVSFRTAMSSASGTQRTSGLSFGTCLTATSILASISASFQFPTGPKWMSGSISCRRTSPCRACISPISAK
jgi:hypothetical protein